MLRWRRAGEVYMKRLRCLKETENKSLTRGGTIGQGHTGNTRANQNWRTDKERGEDWSADRKRNRKYQTHNFLVSFGSLKAELPIIHRYQASPLVLDVDEVTSMLASRILFLWTWLHSRTDEQYFCYDFTLFTWVFSSNIRFRCRHRVVHTLLAI